MRGGDAPSAKEFARECRRVDGPGDDKAMISEEYASVAGAQCVDDLQRSLVAFAQNLGFPTFNAAVVIDRPRDEALFLSVSNTPEAFVQASKSLPDSKRDPVLKRLKRMNVPITWDQATYVDDGAGDLWEAQAGFGYRTGIAMALHLPHGRHFLMGVDRDQPLPRKASNLTRIVADLQLMAVYAQDAAIRLMTPDPSDDASEISLTRRELDVLGWTMEGKSAWVVGQLLGISENTVVFHLKNAMAKLDCGTKHQAVAKAFRLGIL